MADQKGKVLALAQWKRCASAVLGDRPKGKWTYISRKAFQEPTKALRTYHLVTTCFDGWHKEG